MLIYKITNSVNGKVYVGQTSKNNPTRRWSTHKNELNKLRHRNKHLQASWNKHGQGAFTFDIVVCINSKERSELDALERHWIMTLESNKPHKGYNKTDGGEGGSPTEEIRRKISKTKQGKALSEEHKRKISKSNTRPFLGKKHTTAAKLKMSIAKLGKAPAVINIGRPAWNKGLKASPETIRKLSESHKGQVSWRKGRKFGPLSEEHKLKISNALKKHKPPQA